MGGKRPPRGGARVRGSGSRAADILRAGKESGTGKQLPDGGPRLTPFGPPELPGARRGGRHGAVSSPARYDSRHAPDVLHARGGRVGRAVPRRVRGVGAEL